MTTLRVTASNKKGQTKLAKADSVQENVRDCTDLKSY